MSQDPPALQRCGEALQQRARYVITNMPDQGLPSKLLTGDMPAALQHFRSAVSTCR